MTGSRRQRLRVAAVAERGVDKHLCDPPCLPRGRGRAGGSRRRGGVIGQGGTAESSNAVADETTLAPKPWESSVALNVAYLQSTGRSCYVCEGRQAAVRFATETASAT